jgi:hypothetical protein
LKSIPCTPCRQFDGSVRPIVHDQDQLSLIRSVPTARRAGYQVRSSGTFPAAQLRRPRDLPDGAARARVALE